MTLLFRYFAALALAAALLILAILPIFGWSAGVPMSYLTRDPAQLGSLPAYAGVLSNLGVLAWAGGFFVAAFSAAQLDVQRVSPEAAAYMQAVALLTMVLCADDFFLLHESLPIPEELFFAAYALFLGGILLPVPSRLHGLALSLRRGSGGYARWIGHRRSLTGTAGTTARRVSHPP